MSASERAKLAWAVMALLEDGAIGATKRELAARLNADEGQLQEALLMLEKADEILVVIDGDGTVRIEKR